MCALLRLFSRKPLFSDGEIDLVLSNEDVTDRECGILDGYTFYLYQAKTRNYMGYVSLRMGESPALYYLGHIGYRIDEKFRGHGYAARACAMIIPFIQQLGLRTLVITTNVENIASRKTCEKLSCSLERIAPVPVQYQPVCMGAAWKCRYIWRIPPRA